MVSSLFIGMVLALQGYHTLLSLRLPRVGSLGGFKRYP